MHFYCHIKIWMVIMKENIQLHLNKNTISPWSIDKVLSERAFSNFIESFYRQEVFSGSAIRHFSELFNINSLAELLNTRRLSFPRCRLIKQGRSEERRVGKECRSRWSPY